MVTKGQVVDTQGNSLQILPQAQPLVTPPVGSLVLPSVMALERSIKARRGQDTPFMNWWLANLIVVPVTLGIYSLVIFFKMFRRINAFAARRRQYYEAVIEFTARYAESVGKSAEVRDDLRRLDLDGCQALDTDVRRVSPWLALFLVAITPGIYMIVILYRWNKAWYTFETIEQEFDDGLSLAWTKLGLVKYPLTFNVDASKKRSFGLYLVLSFVTLGIWGLVWNYRVYTDPDNTYAEFHSIEDVVLQTARAA